jgi:uncharacterized membrane protein required for colicin V production
MGRVGLIIDLCAVGFVLFCALRGRAKGMVKVLRGVVVPMLAVYFAITLNATVTPTVQEQHFFKKIEVKTEAVLLEKLPTLPTGDSVRLSKEEKEKLEDTLSPFGIKADQAIATVEEAAAAQAGKLSWDPLVDRVCGAIARAIAYVAVFLGAVVLLHILFHLVGFVFKFPILRGLNRTAGMLLGLTKGLLTVLFVSFFLHKMGATLYTVSPSFGEGVNDSYIIAWLGSWLSSRL